MPNIVLKIHTDEALEHVKNVLAANLEEIGIRAEDYAQRLTPVGTPESTGIAGYRGGTLKKSITHKVVADRYKISLYIGTNIKYAPYVELGTGIYATDGNGRKNPWIWVDKNGKAHFTRGMRPHHMLKRAIADRIPEYRKILKKS